MTRRSLLAGAGLLTAATAFGTFSAPATAAPEDEDSPVLEAGGIRAYVDGVNIQIEDGTGAKRLQIHNVDFTGKIKGKVSSATLVEVDGKPALQLECVVAHDEGAEISGYACSGLLTVGDGGFFDLVWDLTTPPEYKNASLAQITRSYTPFEAYKETEAVPVGSWATDDRGGIPYQIPLGTVYSTPVAEDVWVHELTVKNNASWVGGWNFHLPAEQIDDTHYRMVYSGVVGSTTTAAAGAFLGEDTLRIGATTARRFHMWEQETAQLEFDLTTTNKGAPSDITVDWAVYDWDGQAVGEGTQVLTELQGIGTTPVTMDGEVSRGIYFLAATATAGEVVSEVRLNLSVLPPWQNPIPAEESKVGMAALFAEAGAGYGVGRQDWLDLLQRLGVRHIRQEQMLTGEEAEQAGILRWDHGGPSRGQVRVGGEYPEGDVDVEARQELLERYADASEAAGSPWLEWCNEWNMHGANIGAGTGMLTGASAPEYVHDVLIPMREYMDERGLATKLCIMGIAGPDYVWLEKLAEEGGWEITEAVALHPGRGNFTPDYAPTPEEWSVGPEGNYWNYLGAVRAIKETIEKLDAQHGTEHKLFLTEVYAPTFANHWWTDGYRNSAENTLLSLALAYAEEVDVYQWYQLNDGVHWNIDGIEPEDKEFDYGLVMVDGSLKASALAFATSSEHFGGSTLVKEIAVGPEEIDGHGLLFDGPNGPFHVLWSRADGYIQHADHGTAPDGFYDMKDPWVDHWPTKTTVDLAASGEVREVDCLGRERILTGGGSVRAAVAGSVSVTLDGAARIYYGLSADIGREPTPDPGPDPTEDPTDEPDPTSSPTVTPTDSPGTGDDGNGSGDGSGGSGNGEGLPSTGIAGGLLGVAGALGAAGAAMAARRSKAAGVAAADEDAAGPAQDA